MRIPRSGLERFVREIADQCLVSQVERAQRGAYYKNFLLYGSDEPSMPAMYNKTFSYIDELTSLLFSPISLRFHIGDADLPNVVEDAKGRAAATRLRHMCRQSDTDNVISEAVLWALCKGKTLIKQTYKRNAFSPWLVQPEALGVLHENHGKLDEDMEAFVHTIPITTHQFTRMVSGRADAEALIRKAKRYMRKPDNIGDAGSAKQVIVGGLYPFQPAGSPNPNTSRGIVDWMGGPSPTLDPKVMSSIMLMHEVWIWDDQTEDWVTFQIIGDDMLLMGKTHMFNALAYNPASGLANPTLKGQHPFREFCPNPLDNYFWGRSEIVNVAMLQEGMNSRITGINKMLRMEEDPSMKFTGSTGVNQNALARYKKPGGYFVDQNPNAKIEKDKESVPGDVWVALHEYERMFDDMGGLPPIARGKGESGVRSQGHAETLVRMFSPRFKDRALLVERSVESLGALCLDLAKVHESKRIIAWVPEAAAGAEAQKPNPLIIPPAPGQVAVPFMFADLDEDMSLTIDAHSASPAFSAEARSTIYDLFKIGAASAEQVIEHVDAPDPEGLIAGVQRRAAEKAAEIQKLQQNDPQAALKAIQGGKHK